MASGIVGKPPKLADGGEVEIATSPASRERFYLPALDTLRFFAFLCVFVSHLPFILTWQPAVIKNVVVRNTLAAGVFGVDLFFTLSAYLITRLLLQERASSGKIHVLYFYIRRALRIWPLYFLLSGVWICSFILRFRLSIRSAGAEISIAAGDFPGQLCAGQLDGFRLRVEPPVERLGGGAVLLMLADGDSRSVRARDQNDCVGVAGSRISRAGGCLVGGRFVAMDLDLHFYSSGPIRGGYSARYSTVRQGDQPALSLATRSFVGRICGLGFCRVL